jgi:GTP cyclohydrolase II
MAHRGWKVEGGRMDFWRLQAYFLAQESAMIESAYRSLDRKLKGRPDYLEESEYLGRPDADDLVLVARANLPTTHGEFEIVGFYEPSTGKEHTAIVKGDVAGKTDVPLRVHSQCHTGDVLGSLRCDCQAQLEAALDFIGQQEFGVVLYLIQEGRGIGLLNKIKAYQLQDLGLDTIEANVYLGFSPDSRRYAVAARMIELLQVKSIALLTNNPEKIEGLRQAGITITKRIPVVIPENPHNKSYLETKKNHMGHLF